MAERNGINGITISGRLVERILLGVLLAAIGGNSFLNSRGVSNVESSVDRVVETGRIAITNPCEFDNERTRELRTNLQLFLDDHRALHEHVNLTERGSNIAAIQDSINALATRNCTEAANTLTEDKKE